MTGRLLSLFLFRPFAFVASHLAWSVVKLAEGKWQCSDGTTWPSQPSAYRHLRGIRSMNDRLYAFVAHPPFGHLNSHQRGSTNSEESSSDDEATTNSNWMRGRRASPERRPEKHLKVLSHVIDLSLLNSPDPAAYEIARLWTLHGVRQPNTVTAVNAVRRSEVTLRFWSRLVLVFFSSSLCDGAQICASQSTAEGEEPRATVTGVTLDTNHFKTTPLTVPLPTPPSPVNWALAAVPAVDLGDSAKTRRRLLQEFKRPRVPMGAASLAAWAARQARANLQRSLLMAAAAASTPPTE